MLSVAFKLYYKAVLIQQSGVDYIQLSHHSGIIRISLGKHFSSVASFYNVFQ